MGPPSRTGASWVRVRVSGHGGREDGYLIASFKGEIALNEKEESVIGGDLTIENRPISPSDK
jgi:hypothetical protein